MAIFLKEYEGLGGQPGGFSMVTDHNPASTLGTSEPGLLLISLAQRFLQL